MDVFKELWPFIVAVGGAVVGTMGWVFKIVIKQTKFETDTNLRIRTLEEKVTTLFNLHNAGRS